MIEGHAKHRTHAKLTKWRNVLAVIHDRRVLLKLKAKFYRML